MINTTLLKREIKANYILLLIFIFVLTLYAVIIVAMFDPELGSSLKLMAESMPQLFAAVGMLNVGTTLVEFVVGYLYGILLVAFPAVFIIIFSNRLIAKYVDQGAMAYLLATPNKRWKIAVTQAVALIAGIFCLILYVSVLIMCTGQAMFPGELDVPAFLRVNIGLFGLLLFFGGICYCSSCIFNDAKLCNGVGAGVIIGSILIQMISRVGEKIENLKYATPLTLFNTDGLIAGETMAYIQCAVLYAAGLILIAVGIAVFCKKDLSV